VFAYHGAEHKSINCIENGLDLTVENVRTQSRQHKRCGTSFLLFVVFISLIFFLFIRVEQVWLQAVIRVLLVPVIAGLSYEIIRFAGNSENKVIVAISKPGFALQKLTTREPDDSMIEVAIASVEAVYDWKPFVEKVRKDQEVAKRQAAKRAAKAEEAAKKTAELKAVAEKKAEEKKAKDAALAEEKKAKAAEEAAAKEAAKAEKMAKEQEKAEEEAAEKALIAAEETESAAEEEKQTEKAASKEVNLDSLDKVLTVSEKDKEIVFKDPYESRKTPTVTVQEEDDEILKALDRFFVMDEEDEN